MTLVQVIDLCGAAECGPNKECVADYSILSTECHCPECESIYEPVCGSDCKQHYNLCSLRSVEGQCYRPMPTPTYMSSPYIMTSNAHKLLWIGHFQLQVIKL